ncbi:hypothetical protein IQ07DRAFT_555880 [Pyrenochaeta sp. DS3sAY3a]|nr:hypothetical protein IQ07DRAFT_555880 [Pyrenochaeta sp. DS3sAY3a]
MAPKSALVALLLSAFTANAQLSTDRFTTTSDRFPTATSPFWTVTSRYADSISPSPYTRYNGDVTTYTVTDYRTLKSTVTPTATPTSTTTSLDRYYDMKVVYMYYAAGVVPDSDLEPTFDALGTTSYGTTTYIYFSMPVTMTAPASCPTQFTVTTTASVSVPSGATTQVTPTSTTAGPSSSAHYGGMYVYETWWLSEGAAPFTSTNDYYYSYYIASCSTPPVYYTGTPRSGGNDDDDDSSSSGSRYCYYSSYYCGTTLRVWIIIIATVIPGLFLLGFLESWFWFRRLMLGKSAMRFGTVCWVLISLWVLCFTRMQDRRSAEDQKLLAEKWKNMGSGAAFKAWWRWGFRHGYPIEHLGQFSRQTVGIVPAGQPLHPAMAQAPPPGFPPNGGQPGQVFYYGPPPPGWVQGPNGQFVPPQGYAYPPPPQAAYYGDAAKEGSLVSASPVSALGPQQPVYAPSPPPQTQTQSPLTAPQTQTVPAAPQNQGPVSPISEAPNTQRSELPPANPTAPPTNPAAPSPPKNDPNDRSLYE